MGVAPYITESICYITENFMSILESVGKEEPSKTSFKS